MRSFSLRACIIILLANLILFSSYRFWAGNSRVISWDVTLYYSYLPAFFIYDDISFENVAEGFNGKEFYLNEDENGNRYVKMTSGLAILYSPFFFGAHTFAMLSPHYKADGFSTPYPFALLLSSIFYCFLGLLFLRKVLLKHFTERVVGFTLVVLYFGTNMLYYTIKEPMSHIYNFFLFSALLYFYFSFLEHKSWGKAIGIGIVSGLIVLIRPVNVIMFLFPIIHLLTAKPKGTSINQLGPYLLVSLVFAFLAMVPQFIYWHHITGNWVIYSYNGERFYFHDPEIIKGLFSYRKGWFIYSPVLIFASVGFFFFYKEKTKLFFPLIITLFVALWVVFSWWCWWYGGGFGARPLIGYLPLMAFGLAACLKWLAKSPKLLKIPMYAAIFGFTFFSIFYTKQYKSAIIHYDSMSKELFWKQFLIDHFVEGYDGFIEPPDYDAALKNED